MATPRKPTKRAKTKPAKSKRQPAAARRSAPAPPTPTPAIEAIAPTARLTVAALGQALDPPLGERRTFDLLRAGMPRHSIEAAQSWYESRPNHPRKLQDLYAAAAGGDRSELQARRLMAEVLKAEQEARARKLRTDLLDGLLCNQADVMASIARFFARIRTRLEAVPEELCTEAPAALRDALRVRLDEQIHALLTEMGNWSSDEPP
jgi:hypothetical protein